MKRTEVINYLVRKKNLVKYLEIGVKDKQNNFNHINCEYKIGVDKATGGTFLGTSDEFFTQNKEYFDIIFIDGDHSEEQVDKDLTNALEALNSNGTIVIHDCLPPDEWHQRPKEQFVEGEAWNGQVWKAVLKYFNKSKYKCTILDTDYGCGIIDTSISQKPLNRELPEKINYQSHFNYLLDYKINPTDYFRRQVTVFYHLACMGNWQEVFLEQIICLHDNGFNKINLTILGSPQEVAFIEFACQKLGVDYKILFNEAVLTHFEKPALLAIEQYAKNQDGYILYLHSKGVSEPLDKNKVKWRRLMMQHLIVQWEQCVLQLSNFDVIGVNWRRKPHNLPIPHFSGNFWYASTDYIRNLPDFQEYFNSPRYHFPHLKYSERFGCEFWIGASPNTKFLSLGYQDLDFMHTPGFWSTIHIPTGKDPKVIEFEKMIELDQDHLIEDKKSNQNEKAKQKIQPLPPKPNSILEGRGVSIIFIPYNNADASILRLERDLFPTIDAHPDTNFQLLIVDNSDEDQKLNYCIPALSNIEYCYLRTGKNLKYGPSINLALKLAKHDFIVYICSNHGRMYDPTWIDDLVAPLIEHKNIGMTGSLYPTGISSLEMGFQVDLKRYHIQGGLFGARTNTLKQHPYTEISEWIHGGSDIYQSFQLMAAGFELKDVPTVKSVWRQQVANPSNWKYVHDHSNNH